MENRNSGDGIGIGTGMTGANTSSTSNPTINSNVNIGLNTGMNTNTNTRTTRTRSRAGSGSGSATVSGTGTGTTTPTGTGTGRTGLVRDRMGGWHPPLSGPSIAIAMSGADVQHQSSTRLVHTTSPQTTTSPHTPAQHHTNHTQIITRKFVITDQLSYTRGVRDHGPIINQYEVLRKVGKGQHGVVFVGRDIRVRGGAGGEEQGGQSGQGGGQEGGQGEGQTQLVEGIGGLGVLVAIKKCPRKNPKEHRMQMLRRNNQAYGDSEYDDDDDEDDEDDGAGGGGGGGGAGKGKGGAKGKGKGKGKGRGRMRRSYRQTMLGPGAGPAAGGAKDANHPANPSGNPGGGGGGGGGGAVVNRLEDAERKIRREIAIMKKCRHGQIVQLFEVIDDQLKDSVFMIMEYMGGGEVKWRDSVGNPVLTVDQTRRICRDVTLGLEYLHHHGIIHRDIKPANLLWTKDRMNVKITDFGVSHFSFAQRIAQMQVQNNRQNATNATSSATTTAPTTPTTTTTNSANATTTTAQARHQQELEELYDQVLVDDSELAKMAGTPSFVAPEVVWEFWIDSWDEQQKEQAKERERERVVQAQAQAQARESAGAGIAGRRGSSQFPPSPFTLARKPAGQTRAMFELESSGTESEDELFARSRLRVGNSGAGAGAGVGWKSDEGVVGRVGDRKGKRRMTIAGMEGAGGLGPATTSTSTTASTTAPGDVKGKGKAVSAGHTAASSPVGFGPGRLSFTSGSAPASGFTTTTSRPASASGPRTATATQSNLYPHTTNPLPPYLTSPSSLALSAYPHASKPPITPAIDIWALGVTIFCLLFGRVPFLDQGGNEWRVYRLIGTAEFEVPRGEGRGRGMGKEGAWCPGRSVVRDVIATVENPQDNTTLDEQGDGVTEISSTRTSTLSPETMVEPAGRGRALKETERKVWIGRDGREMGEEEAEACEGVIAINLLERLLKKDYRERMTLDEIKNMPWLLRDIPDPEHWLRKTNPVQTTSIEPDERETRSAFSGLKLRLARFLGRGGRGVRRVLRTGRVHPNPNPNLNLNVTPNATPNANATGAGSSTGPGTRAGVRAAGGAATVRESLTPRPRNRLVIGGSSSAFVGPTPTAAHTLTQNQNQTQSAVERVRERERSRSVSLSRTTRRLRGRTSQAGADQDRESLRDGSSTNAGTGAAQGEIRRSRSKRIADAVGGGVGVVKRMGSLRRGEKERDRDREKEKEKELPAKTKGQNKSLNDLEAGTGTGAAMALAMSVSEDPIAHAAAGGTAPPGLISASTSVSPSMAPSASGSATQSASASRVSLTFKGLRSRLGGAAAVAGTGIGTGARSPVSDEDKTKGKRPARLPEDQKSVTSSTPSTPVLSPQRSVGSRLGFIGQGLDHISDFYHHSWRGTPAKTTTTTSASANTKVNASASPQTQVQAPTTQSPTAQTTNPGSLSATMRASSWGDDTRTRLFSHRSIFPRGISALSTSKTASTTVTAAATTATTTAIATGYPYDFADADYSYTYGDATRPNTAGTVTRGRLARFSMGTTTGGISGDDFGEGDVEYGMYDDDDDDDLDDFEDFEVDSLELGLEEEGDRDEDEDLGVVYESRFGGGGAYGGGGGGGGGGASGRMRGAAWDDSELMMVGAGGILSTPGSPLSGAAAGSGSGEDEDEELEQVIDEFGGIGIATRRVNPRSPSAGGQFAYDPSMVRSIGTGSQGNANVTMNAPPAPGSHFSPPIEVPLIQTQGITGHEHLFEPTDIPSLPDPAVHAPEFDTSVHIRGGGTTTTTNQRATPQSPLVRQAFGNEDGNPGNAVVHPIQDFEDTDEGEEEDLNVGLYQSPRPGASSSQPTNYGGHDSRSYGYQRYPAQSPTARGSSRVYDDSSSEDDYGFSSGRALEVKRRRPSGSLSASQSRSGTGF